MLLQGNPKALSRTGPLRGKERKKKGGKREESTTSIRPMVGYSGTDGTRPNFPDPEGGRATGEKRGGRKKEKKKKRV